MKGCALQVRLRLRIIRLEQGLRWGNKMISGKICTTFESGIRYCFTSPMTNFLGTSHITLISSSLVGEF